MLADLLTPLSTYYTHLSETNETSKTNENT